MTRGDDGASRVPSRARRDADALTSPGDAAGQTRRHVELARPQQRRHLAAEDVADDAAAGAGDRAEHDREDGIDVRRTRSAFTMPAGVEEPEPERVGDAQRASRSAAITPGSRIATSAPTHDREEVDAGRENSARRNAEDRVADHAAAERRRERQDEGADHVGPLGATRGDAAHREARDAEEFEAVDHAPTLASA